MAERAVPPRQVRIEVEPPRKVVCPRCGESDPRVVYTTPYPEAGIRRVTTQCRNVRCRAILWYDEEMGK